MGEPSSDMFRFQEHTPPPMSRAVKEVLGIRTEWGRKHDINVGDGLNELAVVTRTPIVIASPGPFLMLAFPIMIGIVFPLSSSFFDRLYLYTIMFRYKIKRNASLLDQGLQYSFRNMSHNMSYLMLQGSNFFQSMAISRENYY